MVKKNCSMFPEWHHAVPESAYFKVPETLKTFRMYSTSRYAPSATRLRRLRMLTPIGTRQLMPRTSAERGRVRGRSQLSTFMKAYREYARGKGSGTTVRFYPENQHLFLITDKKSQCIIKYGTRLESGRTSFSLLYRLLFTTN